MTLWHAVCLFCIVEHTVQNEACLFSPDKVLYLTKLEEGSILYFIRNSIVRLVLLIE